MKTSLGILCAIVILICGAILGGALILRNQVKEPAVEPIATGVVYEKPIDNVDDTPLTPEPAEICRIMTVCESCVWTEGKTECTKCGW